MLDGSALEGVCSTMTEKAMCYAFAQKSGDAKWRWF